MIIPPMDSLTPGTVLRIRPAEIITNIGWILRNRANFPAVKYSRDLKMDIVIRKGPNNAQAVRINKTDKGGKLILP